MGILLDTIEDNSERFGQFLDRQYPLVPVSNQSLDHCPTAHRCDICHALTISFEDLQNHIVQKHAEQHIYLRVNGSVTRESHWLVETLASAQLLCIGDGTASCMVTVDSKPVPEVTFRKQLDLLPLLPPVPWKRIEIATRLGHVNRRFSLNLWSTTEFRNDAIDDRAHKLLFLPLHGQKTPEFAEFQRQTVFSPDSPSYLYAGGLLDYALAFNLVQRGSYQEAKPHFEAALSHLSVFATPFSLTAARVLALRMNSFTLLKGIVPPSRFGLANYFFNSPEQALTLSVSAPQATQTREYGVFVDHYTEVFLDALGAFYDEKWSLFENCLGELHRLNETDRNNLDKLSLMKARAARKRLEPSEAADFYQLLETHPVFRDEALEFMKQAKPQLN